MLEVFGARASWVLVHDPISDSLVSGAVQGPGADYYANFREPAHRGIVGLAFMERRDLFVQNVQRETRWIDPSRMYSSGLHSVLVVPMQFSGKALGVLGVDVPRFSESPPTPADSSRLEAIAAFAASGVSHAWRFAAVEQECPRFGRVTQDRAQARPSGSFGNDVIGTSAAMRAVLHEVALVAPTDCNVLILGETGTGKEVLARAIHAHSRRSSGAFVALNCAALPESLVESELFGYDKGAFTGAVNRKAGNFELASGGTLLLDEIGDMPPQAQVKLLRVVQEREVMRLGGLRPVTVDVRFIAATNQPLEPGMQDGRFRADLYYRLSAFTIVIPPLRARREDIPLLADYWAQRFAGRLHKHVSGFSAGAIDRLVAYDWPGNVRELQNVIERAIVLARHPIVDADLVEAGCRPPRAELSQQPPTRELPSAAIDRVLPFRDAERRAILHALESAAWRISGPSGAAELLHLKPTTLHAKMKKLGIRRPGAQLPARSTKQTS